METQATLTPSKDMKVALTDAQKTSKCGENKSYHSISSCGILFCSHHFVQMSSVYIQYKSSAIVLILNSAISIVFYCFISTI